MPDIIKGDKLVVSPGLVAITAASVTAAGAFLCGSLYLASTRRALIEEGIELQARTRAVPLAGRALLLSTLGCVGIGSAAWFAFHIAGGQTAQHVQLSSWEEASQLLQQQRQLISQAFKRAIMGQNSPEEHRADRRP